MQLKIHETELAQKKKRKYKYRVFRKKIPNLQASCVLKLVEIIVVMADSTSFRNPKNSASRKSRSTIKYKKRVGEKQ
jgi:hypothetical protein